MKERIEKQFNNPPPLESESPKQSAQEIEQFLSQKQLFTEAVEKIKTNEIAVKLLAFKEKDCLLLQKELFSINIEDLVKELLNRCPTINDVEKNLEKIVNKMCVAYQNYQKMLADIPDKQYRETIQKEYRQYNEEWKEAVQIIVNALEPVYEKSSDAVSSPPCKKKEKVKIIKSSDFNKIDKLRPVYKKR